MSSSSARHSVQACWGDASRPGCDRQQKAMSRTDSDKAGRERIQETPSLVLTWHSPLTCRLWCCMSSLQGSQTCHRPHGNSWLSSAYRRSASRSCLPSPPHSPLSPGSDGERQREQDGFGCLPPGYSGSGKREARERGVTSLVCSWRFTKQQVLS